MTSTLFGKPSNEADRMLKNFSLTEFAILAGTYKHMFKDQLRMPSADNNHLINYNLKLQNYVIINSSVHMISAGMLTFLVRGFLGNFIDRTTLNYLGTRRQIYGQIFIYGIIFWYTMSTLNHSKRLNVNHLINPRDFNGEIMMNLTLKYYPQKVNQTRYRQMLMDKYESQIIRLNSYEQMMGIEGSTASEKYYKLANPEAVHNHIQSQQADGVASPQGIPGASMGGLPTGMPTMPGMPQMPGMMQPGGMPGLMMPGLAAKQGGMPMPQMMHQQQQVQQHIGQNHHVEEQHLKAIINKQAQPDPNQKPQTPTDQASQIPNSTVPQVVVNNIQQDRQRIIDQMRDQHQKSPYLSTNPIMTQQQQKPQQQLALSPYANISQEIKGHSSVDPARYQEAMNNYYMQNVNLPQQQENSQYRYQGHYFNVAQQAKKDTS